MLFFSVLNFSYTIQQIIFLSVFSNAHLLATEHPCLDCLQPSFMVLGVNRKLKIVYSSPPPIHSSAWFSFPYTFIYLLCYFFWCVCACWSIYVACIYMWSLSGVCVWFICRVCVWCVICAVYCDVYMWCMGVVCVVCFVCCTLRCSCPCRGVWKPEVDLRFSSSIAPLPLFDERSLTELAISHLWLDWLTNRSHRYLLLSTIYPQ